MTVVTSSKTVALPTARVAFVTTINPGMRAALSHYRTVFSFGHAPQAGELSALAALCLTPRSWIEDWNTEYRRRLALLTAGLEGINADLGAGSTRSTTRRGAGTSRCGWPGTCSRLR